MKYDYEKNKDNILGDRTQYRVNDDISLMSGLYLTDLLTKMFDDACKEIDGLHCLEELFARDKMVFHVDNMNFYFGEMSANPMQSWLVVSNKKVFIAVLLEETVENYDLGDRLNWALNLGDCTDIDSDELALEVGKFVEVRKKNLSD